MFIQITSDIATVCKKKSEVPCQEVEGMVVLWQSGVVGDKSEYADQGGAPKLVSVNPGDGTLGQFPPCL